MALYHLDQTGCLATQARLCLKGGTHTTGWIHNCTCYDSNSCSQKDTRRKTTSTTKDSEIPQMQVHSQKGEERAKRCPLLSARLPLHWKQWIGIPSSSSTKATSKKMWLQDLATVHHGALWVSQRI